MANRDLIDLQNTMLTGQIEDFVHEFNEKIESGNIQDEGAVLHSFFAGMREVFARVGKPTMKVRKIPPMSPPRSSDINDTFEEVLNDTRLIFDQQKLLSSGLKRNFNYGVTERSRLRNKIRRVGEMVNDYVVLARNTLGRFIIMQDTFVTKDNVDLSSVNNPVTVDTDSAIVTLQIVGKIHRTKGAKILGSPNLSLKEAMPGNFLIPYKKNVTSYEKSGDLMKNRPGSNDSGGSDDWDLEFNIDPHADPNSMFDEKPNTWMEWQVINIPESWKSKDNKITKGYGMTYRDGSPIYGGVKGKDFLGVSFTIRLEKPTTINKIVLNPYIPAGSGLVYRVNEISTSLNNTSDYKTVFLDTGDYHQTLGGDPADNAADLEKKDRGKYSDKGVWLFPARKVQFIKISLTCEEAYDCKVAHLFWEREYDVVSTTKKKFLFMTYSAKIDVSHVVERYEGNQLDRGKLDDFYKNYAIEGGLAGIVVSGMLGFGLVGAAIMFMAGFLTSKSTTHEVQNLKYHENYGLDIIDGWRWCVGIKELNAYADKYAESSVMVTKNKLVHKPISEVSLSVSELIPEEFYKNNLSTKNEWIKYFLSFDDGKSWFRISPIEHTPVGFSGEVFPNKVIAVNSTTSPDTRVPNKTYVQADTNSIKLMAEFSRPGSSDDVTPVLYDYQIRIVPKETEDI